MAKKIRLNDLKVSSFATSLNKDEQEQAKGGYYFTPGGVVNVNGGKHDWTGIKTRITNFASQNLDAQGF